MKWEIIDLKDAPEALQVRVKEKLNMHDGSGQLLQVVETEHRHVAYLNAGNLCTILSVWKFDEAEVTEDSMTVGEIKEFINHPIMKVWFA